jgi:hypothetical protein
LKSFAPAPNFYFYFFACFSGYLVFYEMVLLAMLVFWVLACLAGVLAYFPWVCVVENLAIGYLYDTMLGWIYAVEFPDCVCALGHT